MMMVSNEGLSVVVFGVRVAELGGEKWEFCVKQARRESAGAKQESECGWMDGPHEEAS